MYAYIVNNPLTSVDPTLISRKWANTDDLYWYLNHWLLAVGSNNGGSVVVINSLSLPNMTIPAEYGII